MSNDNSIYHLQAFGWEHDVSDYEQEVREVVVVAESEEVARTMIPCESECCHRESPLHAQQCFWVTSADVTVTLLGRAQEGQQTRLVTVVRERGFNGGC